MKRYVFLLKIILLALLSVSCLITTSGIKLLDSGSDMYKDDFSDASSGWDHIQKDTHIAGYVNGAYMIFVNETYVDIWSSPDRSFRDAIVEVEATKGGGPDDNNYGLICRLEDSGEGFYFFVISSDGYYGIGKVVDDEQMLLGEDVMQPSEAINVGAATNSIRAECIGDRLTLFVNEIKLADVSDTEFFEGDVGLVVGTFDQPGVNVYFDNFQVQKR